MAASLLHVQAILRLTEQATVIAFCTATYFALLPHEIHMADRAADLSPVFVSGCAQRTVAGRLGRWKTPRRARTAFATPNSSTLLIATTTAAGKPGVENMLGDAPPPATAKGLDIRVGHPAGPLSEGQTGPHTSKL